MAALFVLASNTLSRPVVNRINRSPFREEAGEASYMVFVICARESQFEVREKVAEVLEGACYSARQIGDHPFGEGEVEIEFTLYATAVQTDELNGAVRMAEALPGVRQAFWNAGDDG